MGKFFRLVTKLIPFVILAVRVVEEAASDGEWTSEEKRNAGIAAVQTFAETFDYEISEEGLETAGKLIDAVVGIYNAIGAFRKNRQV